MNGAAGVRAVSRSGTTAPIRSFTRWSTLEKSHVAFSQCRRLAVLRRATDLCDTSNRNVSDLAFRPSRRLNLDARVEHVLTKTHTARFQFQRNAGVQNNLGVGDFDLPSRGYSQDQTEYIARFADSGVFGKKFFNEVRLQARWLETEARSVSLGQTILVPGAFNDGSAQRSGGRTSTRLRTRRQRRLCARKTRPPFRRSTRSRRLSKQ